VAIPGKPPGLCSAGLLEVSTAYVCAFVRARATCKSSLFGRTELSDSLLTLKVKPNFISYDKLFIYGHAISSFCISAAYRTGPVIASGRY
jgi:hypothetical protein